MNTLQDFGMPVKIDIVMYFRNQSLIIAAIDNSSSYQLKEEVNFAFTVTYRILDCAEANISLLK